MYPKQIAEVEHEGDTVTHEIADRLNRTSVAPLDHEDIHDLAGRMDDILENIEATADGLFLYEARAAAEQMVSLSEVLADAARALAKAITGMTDMARNGRRILDHCIEIHRLENVGDEESRHALAELFGEADALDALTWREICDHVENAIDRCEDVASVVEGIVVKQT